MYTIIVFALALLSPMPFISPFDYGVQDATAQSPFGPFGSDQNLPTDAIPNKLALVLMPDTSGDVIDADRSVTDVTISNVVVFCAIASVGRF